MKRAIVSLVSATPYQQSKFHETPKKPKQGHDDYEKETWREKCHYLSDGTIYIPAQQIKNALCEASPYLGEKIKGERNATWTKHFLAGVRVISDIILDVKKDDVAMLPQLCASDGKRGGSKKVKKYFPLLHNWSGDVEIIVLDDKITQDVLVRHLATAGSFIGIGKQRPAKGGDFGRFVVGKVVWEDNYVP